MVKSIFEIPNLLHFTLENTKRSLQSNYLCNFASGEIFKLKKQKMQSALVIPYFLYLDHFQINNPLGSHTHSICGCYLNFPTMPQHLLSKLEYIFHAAFISSENLKNCGNSNTFYHLVEELKLLEEGIEIVAENTKFKVSFILGLIVGDNLAVNSILGFVQSFNSLKYCRVCTRTKAEMQYDVHENVDYLRTKKNYEEDLLKNNFQATGLKSSCIFNELNYFYVTDNFCFDLMHDIYEGVCIYDVCNVLVALINEKVVTLNTINNRKKLFQFGETEIGNNSVPLCIARLKTFNLKMSASEIGCFIHFLPLIIGDLIPIGNKNWELLITLLQILDFLLKPTYNYDELSHFQQLIKKTSQIYTKLYGTLKPKHHFLVHYATAIKKCGPLKYMWSMRFEAKHKESKMYLNNITSRVNPSRSLAIKSAIKFSSFLLDHESSLEPVFSYKSSKTVDLRQYDFFSKIISIPDINFTNVDIIDELTYKSTLYKPNYFLAIRKTAIDLFEIKTFLHQNENIYVVCYRINVKCFHNHFQSYEIEPRLSSNTENVNIINICNFTSPPLHVYFINNSKAFIRLKYI